MVAEQRKQMQQQSESGGSGAGEGPRTEDTGLLVAPKITYGVSTEEQALKKEQVRKNTVDSHYLKHL